MTEDLKHTFILSENGNNTPHKENEIIIDLSKYKDNIRQLFLQYSEIDKEYPWRMKIKHQANTVENLIKALQYQNYFDTDPVWLEARLIGGALTGNDKEYKKACRLLEKLPEEKRCEIEKKAGRMIPFWGNVLR